MKNVIAFSLWENTPSLVKSANKNIKLAKHLFPGWVCRFYVSSDIHKETVNSLNSHNNTEVILIQEQGTPLSSLWRFEVADDVTVDRFIVRDVDRLLIREEVPLVEEWLESDKIFHIIREENQLSPMVPGLWGMNCGKIKGIKEMVEEFMKTGYHDDSVGVDQAFMWAAIIPLAQMSNHSSFLEEETINS